MKKVVTIAAAALFLGACYCNTCTKNSCKPAPKQPVKQAEPVKQQPAPAPKPAPKAVEEKDFTEVATVAKKEPGKLVLTYKEPINFRYNSDELDAASLKPIKQTARALKKYPEATVRVAGYTDSLGDANYNVDLSQRRAKAVAMELVKEGVPAKNVSFIGYGEAKPIASNKTREGRAKNRRVELEVTNH